jgi:sugar phosphate isomerase/epimerase
MSETGADYFAICDIAKDIGFSGIEFTDLKGGEDTAALAAEIREHCAAIGLDVISYTVGANFITDDMAAETERVKKCVDIASILGAPIMRHDACWSLPAGERQTYRDAIRIIAPAIREVSEYAASKGIRTCTENHGYLLQDAYRVEELIMAVDNPNYGWLVDIGNFICADEDSLHSLSIAAPYAFHAHAKDFLVKPGSVVDPGEGWFKSRGGNYLRGTVVGHGVIPVPQCLDMLKSAGYDGYVSYEFEGLESNIPALKMGYEYLKRFVQ